MITTIQVAEGREYMDELTRMIEHHTKHIIPLIDAIDNQWTNPHKIAIEDCQSTITFEDASDMIRCKDEVEKLLIESRGSFRTFPHASEYIGWIRSFSILIVLEVARLSLINTAKQAAGSLGESIKALKTALRENDSNGTSLYWEESKKRYKPYQTNHKLKVFGESPVVCAEFHELLRTFDGTAPIETVNPNATPLSEQHHDARENEPNGIQ